jgi:hypothetical protein
MWARCLSLRSRLFFNQFAFHQTIPFRRGAGSSCYHMLALSFQRNEKTGVLRL